MSKEPPLIVTLKLDNKSQAYFDAQRQLYFPPERNYLTSHLTLFHQLPNEEATHSYFKTLQYEAFALETIGLMNLGAGVAYKIHSPTLEFIYGQLSDHFSNSLIPQDRQPLRPHITIMNKSTPENARAVMTTLAKDFQPFGITGIGLDLWIYLDGPWKLSRTVYFSASAICGNSRGQEIS